jgi:hypothetical protein
LHNQQHKAEQTYKNKSAVGAEGKLFLVFGVLFPLVETYDKRKNPGQQKLDKKGRNFLEKICHSLLSGLKLCFKNQ